MSIDTGKLRAMFPLWLREGAPGGQIVVRQHGQVLVSECIGLADIERNVPITPETVFHVASVSKQITCACVLLLYERAQLDIDADIRTYIPDLVAFAEPVTVCDLMNNVSGVRDQWTLQIMRGVRITDHICQRDLLHTGARQKSLNFRPRSRYLYSNAGFSLLAEIVERVSGMPFARFAKANIFDPLGMARTVVRERHSQIIPGRALSYTDNGDGTYEWEPLCFGNYGATSLHTTASDFVLWLGQLRKPTIMKPETLARMLTVPVLTSPDEKTSYACGVSLGEHDGHAFVQHGGADAGYRSTVYCYPQAEIEIAIFANVENAQIDRAARKIAEMLLGIEKEDAPFAPDARFYQEQPREPETTFEAELEAAQGEYVLPAWQSALKLTRGADGFALQIDERATPLIPVSGNCCRVGTTQIHLYVQSGKLTLTAHGGEHVLSRVSLPRFSETELAEYPGYYYSDELEAGYEVRRHGDELRISHPRYGEAALIDCDAEAMMARLQYPFRIAFRRGDNGKVEAFSILDGRVLDMRFYKR